MTKHYGVVWFMYVADLVGKTLVIVEIILFSYHIGRKLLRDIAVWLASTNHSFCLFTVFIHTSLCGLNCSDKRLVDSYLVTMLAWVLLLLVLSLLVQVLNILNDTDTDTDYRWELCKQGIHKVYVYLPIGKFRRHFLSTRSL